MYTELERFEAFVYLMQEDKGKGMKESFCCRLFMTKLRFELAFFPWKRLTIHARNAVKVAFYFSASSVDCKVSMTDIKKHYYTFWTWYPPAQASLVATASIKN